MRYHLSEIICGQFCRHIRDEISTFLHLLSFLKDFPSYLADQKYCMLKDLSNNYLSAKSHQPSMFYYEMARWWSFITYVTKSCRDKNDLQLQELTVAQDFALALSSKHIFKGQYVDYLKQYYLTWSTSWFFLDTSLNKKRGITYVTSHTWQKLKMPLKSVLKLFGPFLLHSIMELTCEHKVELNWGGLNTFYC